MSNPFKGAIQNSTLQPTIITKTVVTAKKRDKLSHRVFPQKYPPKDGQMLNYKCNAYSTFLLTMHCL